MMANENVKFCKRTTPAMNITQHDLTILEQRFRAYTGSFTAGAADPEPYRLKQVHTARVCENIVMLAQSLGLDREIVNTAKAAALVHDTGRFVQFQEFGTFSDARSKNHAALGVRVILAQGMLKGIPRPARQCILRAVALHNRPVLPRHLAPDLSVLSRLLRDADKLDIFKVMLDLYQGPENGRQSFITHDQEDDGTVSGDLAECIIAGQMFGYDKIRTLNDMKLFQIGMIFDLNVPAAFKAVQDRGVVNGILDSMPGFPERDRLVRAMDTYITSGIQADFQG